MGRLPIRRSVVCQDFWLLMFFMACGLAAGARMIGARKHFSLGSNVLAVLAVIFLGVTIFIAGRNLVRSLDRLP